jgi:PAS domain S-box-containing protein
VPDPEIASPSPADARATNPVSDATNDTTAPSAAHAPAAIAEAVFRHALDAIIVTDADATVKGWNPAAERTYGISAADALERPLDDILSPSTTKGAEIGGEVLEAVRMAGEWRRRFIQRPLIGSRIDDEIVVDTVITALRGPDGSYAGAVSFNRDVTTTARLAADLTTLGSLSVSSGPARARGEIADAALEMVCRAAEADAGLILWFEESFEVVGRIGLSDETVRVILSYGEIGPRLMQTLESTDEAVSVDVDDSPLREDIRDVIQSDGIAHLAFTGMRVSGRLVGVIGLGWHRPTISMPSGPVLLQAAALVASALENTRLIARVEHGLELERSLTARLQALVELTRLPDEAADQETIAQYLLERIVSVLGAVAGSVVQLEGGNFRTIASHELPPAFQRLLATRPVEDWGFHRRFAADSKAYIESIEPGAVSPDMLAAGESAGLRAYAVFPIRTDAGLDGVLMAGFTQRATDLPIDARTLEAIGRVIDISFANQRLRRIANASEARYRTLFEQSPDALVVLLRDGVVVDANPAARAMFGDDLVGRPHSEFAVVDEEELARQREIVFDEGAVARTGLGRRRDGSTFAEEVESTRIQIEGEDRILARVRDTTERDRLQQEGLQAQKMDAIGLLVAGVAHELNNPLASIVAFSQLIRTDPNLPAELHHDADLLIQESNRTMRIVQNLLDFARQHPPERKPTGLRGLVEGVLSLQSYTFGPGRIEAILMFPADIPAVPLDRAQIRQVIVNLTLNAAQAIKTRTDRGTIRIAASRVSRDDGAPLVRLSITDDGPGVPEGLRSRLFVPFFTTKAPGDGTGLGLSVSFGIVAGHGGTLRYEPGPSGVGASFILDLPLDGTMDAAGPLPTPASPLFDGIPSPVGGPVVPAGRPVAAGAPGESTPKRVLVLDDDAAIREFLARILRRGGYEPVVASEGSAALEIVRSDPPDAILCDHRMAGMTGTVFHDEVARISPGLAVHFAFMSGDVLNPELRDFAVSRGITLLAKPFDIESVDRTVAQIIALPPTST